MNKFFRVASAVAVAVTTITTAVQAEDYKVAIVLPGPITDNGWNQEGYAGLQRIGEKLGAHTAHSEQVPQADHAEVIGDYARRDYDLIIAHGGEFEAAVMRVARRFPETTFAITNGDGAGDNVAMIEHNFWQFGYAFGYLGALMSDTGKAGFIGAEPIKICVDFQEGYTAGFMAANPDGEVLVTYTNDWQDVAKAKQAALLQVSQGADVILPVLDNGVLGVFEGAKEKNVWAFGIYADYIEFYPDVALQSAMLDIATALENFGTLDLAGEAEGKVYSYGFGSDAASLGTYHGDVSDEVKSEMDSIIAKLESGEISR